MINAVNYAANSPIAGKLMVVTAIMGILSSWNGFIIGATRVLYSIGRAKMLSDFFGKLHNIESSTHEGKYPDQRKCVIL